MDKISYLDENYSTTRLLTKDKPLLEQKTEYKLEPQLFLLPNAEQKGEGGLRTQGYFKKSYNNKPLISVITVVYNGEKHLEQTINSVIAQDYDNVEYIIIDGGSTDGTLEIIKKYEDQIDYWVSEPDSGIYNAMNKGASLCNGEYIAFLNADDWYSPNTLETVSESMSCGTPVVCFNAIGPKDIVEHEINGYLATPFDSEDLKNGIEWVLDAENYDELCKNTRKKVLEKFDSNVVAKQYRELYEEVLSR